MKLHTKSTLFKNKMQFNKGPGHSWEAVICPTASRLVAIKRHPGFSRMQRVPYLLDEI